MRRGRYLVIGLLLCGCGSKQDLFPLELGRSTSYVVRTGMVEFVAALKVQSEVAVGGVPGYELEGPLGTYRVAWNDGVLVAERLGGTRFRPPLPLLVSSSAKVTREWRGAIGFAGEVAQATAHLEQKPDSLTIGTKKYECTQVRILARMPGREIELITHYAPGVGILRQEQRMGSEADGKKLFLGMEYLSGK